MSNPDDSSMSNRRCSTNQFLGYFRLIQVLFHGGQVLFLAKTGRILGFVQQRLSKRDRRNDPDLQPIQYCETPESFEGFDLRLMSSLNDVSGIPTEGKNLIIVAAVNNGLHFRIFDGNGKVVVDTDEKRLTGQARQIEDLRKQLESLWPPHELTRSDKDRVITAVTSIVSHTSFEEYTPPESYQVDRFPKSDDDYFKFIDQSGNWKEFDIEEPINRGDYWYGLRGTPYQNWILFRDCTHQKELPFRTSLDEFLRISSGVSGQRS